MPIEDKNLENQNDISSSPISDDRLMYDKLTFYYISLPIVLLGNILGALLLSVMQFTFVDLYSIEIWLMVAMIMFLYQLYHYYTFKKESEENKLRDSQLWLDKYYTNILLTGTIWGSAAFLMFPENDLMNQMIVMLFIFAIGFSSMSVLASKRDLLLAYVMLTFTPLVLRLFFMENPLYTKIAYVVLALMLIMVIIANFHGRVINQSLENRQDFITIKHTHEKLKERFFSLFERAPVGIYYYSKELKLQDINNHFMQMHKLSEKEMLLNKKLHALKDDPQIIEAHTAVFEGKSGNYRGPFPIQGGGSNLYVNLSTVPMHDAEGKIAGGITIINDITNEVTAKQKMVRHAYYDMLTNIPNRTLLMDKLKTFISEKQDNDEYSALLYLDIDNFKKLNDTYGHDAGDHLLKQVVNRIENFIGPHEFFARITGDKFVIHLSSLHALHEESKQMSMQYVSTIHSQFIQPFNVAGEDHHVNFTIGIMLFNDSDISAFDILKRSEIAMYAAKKEARGTSQFFHRSMGHSNKETLALENDLYKAIQNDELSLHFQPQLNFSTNQIIGAETLVRWKHPKKDFISPDIFLPIAEESGMVIMLEEWILNKMFEEIKRLVNTMNTFPLASISINIHTIHFLEPRFVEKIVLLLSKYKIKPEWITFELTENTVMRNITDAMSKMKELHALGFHFAIDDFATGYSSLAYLKELPVTTLKIDRSFVFNIHENLGDAMVVQSIVSIANKFNLKVLAEGVENEETFDYLNAISCDYYQGHYAYKSMAMETFIEVLFEKLKITI